MSRKITTEQFIEKAKEIHGDIYDYSLVEYKSHREKVKIICKKHNYVFQMTPEYHIGKTRRGCQKCSNKYKRNIKEIQKIL